MGSILIGMPRVEDAKKISEMLKSRGFMQIELCTTGTGILSKVHLLDWGIVICPKDLKDMHYREIAENLPEYFELLLLSAKDAEERSTPEITVITVPFRTAILCETVDRMLNRLERRIKEARQKPRRRSREEQECVDQAKRRLMEKEKMTEPEAFRYIQKCSMDSCINMTETAKDILQRYTNGQK